MKETNKRRTGAMALVFAMFAALLALAASPVGAQEQEVVVVHQGQSIQAAIDAASPGTKIVIRGNHVENVWISKNGISLVGRGATLTTPDEPIANPCIGPDGDIPVPMICVTPVGSDIEPPAPDDYVDNVTVRDLSLDGVGTEGDGIAVVFANNVSIKRNTVTDTGCDGIFLIFSTNFSIVRNDVSGAGCEGIGVRASRRGGIRHNRTSDGPFAGIGVGDTAALVIRRNVASGNCIGIFAFDGADGGYGIREQDFSGDRLRVAVNTTNSNNKTCPFGPLVIGTNGILIAGPDNVVVRKNTAHDNTGPSDSVTAAGIGIRDFLIDEGPFNKATNVTVIGNRARRNSSATGPVDLAIESEEIGRVLRNRCDVSVPDPSWC